MIQPPRRSVTRFFLPLIDVLTLLFCIFLLSPVMRSPAQEGTGNVGEAERLRQQRTRLEQDVRQLRMDRREILQGRLAVQVLQIDSQTGKLLAYSPSAVADRWVDVTRGNVQAIVDRARAHAGDKAVYFLILYPRPAHGEIAFPTLAQRREYDQWFAGVAHGYDIPMSPPT